MCMHEALLLRCCRYIPVNNLGSFQKAGQRKDFRLRAEQTLMQVWGRWRTEQTLMQVWGRWRTEHIQI